MATIAHNTQARFAPIAWAGYIAQLVRDAWTRQAAYNAVISELSVLSDRELADIGVSRGDFHVIARDAATKA